MALTTALAAPGAPAEPPPSEAPLPQASPAVQALLDQANRAAAGGHIDVALQAAEQALALARQSADAAGETQAQRGRAVFLSSLGDLALQQHGPASAKQYYEQALAIREKLAPGSAAVAASLNSLGGLAFLQGDLATAKQHFLHALLIEDGLDPGLTAGSLTGPNLDLVLAIGAKLAPSSMAAATSLTGLGNMALQQGDLAKARQYHEQALAIREKLALGSADIAASLNNLGDVADKQGDLTAARQYFQRALAIEERLAPGSLDVATVLANLGAVARDQGLLTEARQYLRRAVAAEMRLAPDTLHVAASLCNLAIVTSDQGDLSRARLYLQQALAIQEKLAPGSPDRAAILSNLGMIAVDQSDMEAAQHYYQRALAIHQRTAPDSLDVADSLDNLAGVAREQGQFAKAVHYLQQALAIQTQLAPGSLRMATSLSNLALVAMRQRNLEAARHYFERAVTIRQKLAPGSLFVATTLNDLGLVAAEQRDLAAARDYLRHGLAIREKLAPASLAMAGSLGGLGLVAERQGQWREAEHYYREAWDITRQQAGSISGDESRQAFYAANTEHAARLLGAQLALGEPAAAFTTLEESRARALRQLLCERQVTPRETDPHQWAAYQRALAVRDQAEHALSRAGETAVRAAEALLTARNEPNATTLLAPRQAAVAAARRQLESAHADYIHARDAVAQEWTPIEKHSPRWFAPPLSLIEAQRALPAGTLLIAFAVGPEKMHLFLLRPGHAVRPELRSYTVPVGVQALQHQVWQFRQALSRPDPLPESAPYALFATLFPPAARPWIRAARRLLISPDGPLWELPFATLVTNRAGPPRYLGLEKPLTYTPSLTLFAQLRREPPARRPGQALRALVVAPFIATPGALVASRPAAVPDGGDERGLLMRLDGPSVPLPASKTEAEQIARLYHCQPLLGAAATEAAVRRQIGSAAVIHLATHGYLHPLRAMDSGVLLTPPEKEPPAGQDDNDGVLQAWEIASQLHLKADLVVLSACETGEGQNVRSEGIVGLVRSLQIAGARSVVASQWAVADESTAALMVAFHRNLRAGLPRDESLRQAMLRIQRDPATAHPYYWAPFFLIGDPDNPSLGGKRGRR